MTREIGRRSQLNLRLSHLRVFMAYSLLGLALSLLFFQVLRGEHYSFLSTQNKIRVIRTSSPRGEVTDVHGAPLAVSVRTFDIVGYPPDLKEAKVLGEVAAVLKKRVSLRQRKGSGKAYGNNTGLPTDLLPWHPT